VVAGTFELAPHTAPVTNGYDIVFQDYRRGEQILGLEWDNWTGFTVVAKSSASEPLVREIAAWLLKSQWAARRDSAEQCAAPERGGVGFSEFMLIRLRARPRGVIVNTIGKTKRTGFAWQKPV